MRKWRVLIVEDEPLIAMMLEDMLGDLGCVVAGMAADLPNAIAKAGTLDIDLTVLDLNLGRQTSVPVAEVLIGRSIPFLVTTGSGEAELPPQMQGAVMLSKPFSLRLLEEALAKIN